MISLALSSLAAKERINTSRSMTYRARMIKSIYLGRATFLLENDRKALIGGGGSIKRMLSDEIGDIVVSSLYKKIVTGYFIGLFLCSTSS